MTGTNPPSTSTLPGLNEPAEIVVDQLGHPAHPRGQRHDVFFLQGFNAARDRLWQIDLWRKRGLGLLAADFGPGYPGAGPRRAAVPLSRRHGGRVGRLRRRTREAIVEAFVAGINAYIALTRARAATCCRRSSRSMGTQPQRWAAEDVVRIRSHALMRNVASEVLRAQVAGAGRPADRPAAPQAGAAHGTPKSRDGLDLGDVPPDVLDVFRLATAPVDFQPERLAAKARTRPGMDARSTTSARSIAATPGQGSNNWDDRTRRTATGRPILANDPHRAHAVPSLRYIVHLTAPGLDVIGAGEPALPGISIGHNGTRPSA